MALTQDTPLAREIGDFNELPVAASSTIYEGSMVGDSSGYARALVAGDAFRGHARQQADNSAGDAGDINVKLLSGKYRLEVTLASVAITDVGKDVYASADDTYTLTQSTNSFVGKVVRYVTTNTCVVEFSPDSADVQNHQHTAATDGGALTSPRVVTGINDTNGNELLKVTATTSAVNEITLANAATGNGPSLAATGETNVDITLAGKGTGSVILGQATSTGVKLAADQPILDSSGAELVKFVKTATAVNEITVTNNSTGQAPSISATGETNVGLNIVAKGTGTLQLGQVTGKVAIATAATDYVGFFGATPVVRQEHVADPSGEASGSSTDAEARTAINAILVTLERFGFHKTS